jgi:hypothetical protein
MTQLSRDDIKSALVGKTPLVILLLWNLNTQNFAKWQKT